MRSYFHVFVESDRDGFWVGLGPQTEISFGLGWAGLGLGFKKRPMDDSGLNSSAYRGTSTVPPTTSDFLAPNSESWILCLAPCLDKRHCTVYVLHLFPNVQHQFDISFRSNIYNFQTVDGANGLLLACRHLYSSSHRISNSKTLKRGKDHRSGKSW